MNPFIVPVVAIAAGIMIMMSPWLLKYFVSFGLVAYGVYELSRLQAFAQYPTGAKPPFGGARDPAAKSE